MTANQTSISLINEIRGIENSHEELSCEKASTLESLVLPAETANASVLAKDDTTAMVKLTDSQDISAKKIDNAPANNRTNYTKEQVEVLKQFFLQTPYPDPEMLEMIGKHLGVAERKIKIWFQNKRARTLKEWHKNGLYGNMMHPQMQPRLPPVAAGSIPNAVLPPVTAGSMPNAVLPPVTAGSMPNAVLPPVTAWSTPNAVLPPVTAWSMPNAVLPPVTAWSMPNAVLPPVTAWSMPNAVLPPVTAWSMPNAVLPPVTAWSMPNAVLPPVTAWSMPNAVLPPVTAWSMPNAVLPPVTAWSMPNAVLPPVTAWSMPNAVLPPVTAWSMPNAVLPPVTAWSMPNAVLPPVTAGSMPNAVLPSTAHIQQYPSYQQYSGYQQYPSTYKNNFQNLASSAPNESMLIQGPHFTPHGNAKIVSRQTVAAESSFNMPIELQSTRMPSISHIDNSELDQNHYSPFSSAFHHMTPSQLINGPEVPQQQMQLSPHVHGPNVPQQQMPPLWYVASTPTTEK